MLTQWMGGSEKVKNYADVIYERPLRRTHYWPRFFTAIKSHNTSRQELLKPLRHIFRDRSRHYQFFLSPYLMLCTSIFACNSCLLSNWIKQNRKLPISCIHFDIPQCILTEKNKFLSYYMISLFHQIKLSRSSSWFSLME